MDNSIYKKCEVCGQEKHISEFSKSYRNRCKACVAEHTREVRAAGKLTARVKATGETLEVAPSGTMQISCGSFITKDGRRIPVTALEFEKEIDWEQRRYEIAKAAISAIMSNEEFYAQVLYEGAQLDGRRGIPANISHAAVVFADALIEELKKGGKE